MKNKSLNSIRKEIERLNFEILDLLNRRMELVEEIRKIKDEKGIEYFDPVRESEMLQRLLLKNRGPLSSNMLKHLFKEIFKASLEEMETKKRGRMMVQRREGEGSKIVEVKGIRIGGEEKVIIAGPCAIESYEQLSRIADFLLGLGVRLLRGGAFKPRTSPYTFQGLKEKGVQIMRRVAEETGIVTVSELLDPRDYELMKENIDILQIGTRNMYNYELLKLIGEGRKPILLKRGFMANLEEYIYAAEYVRQGGNDNIILCERGIRTFERWTRNTLDISAVPLLKIETPFPVIVDVTHAAGRKDILVALAKASLSAGADGIMVEVHPNPKVALSDSDQQMDFTEFESFLREILSK